MPKLLAYMAKHQGNWPITASMCYPYYYFWKNLLKSKFGLAQPYLSLRY